MGNVTEVLDVNQATYISEVHQARNIGIDLVPSANVSRHRFYGPRPGRRSISARPELSQHDRIVALRRDLTILRRRLQDGLPVTADCVIRVENLARTLEAERAA